MQHNHGIKLTEFEEGLMNLVNMFVYDKKEMEPLEVKFWANSLYNKAKKQVREEMMERIKDQNTMKTETPMTEDEAFITSFPKNIVPL